MRLEEYNSANRLQPGNGVTTPGRNLLKFGLSVKKSRTPNSLNTVSVLIAANARKIPAHLLMYATGARAMTVI